MSALGKALSGLFGGRRPPLQACALPQPDPINCNPRKMTGLWSTLTAEEKAAVLAYDGPENHGDPAFLAKR